MYSKYMSMNLCQLFALLDDPSGVLPFAENPGAEGELFLNCEESKETAANEQVTGNGQIAESGHTNLSADAAIVASLYSSGGLNFSALPKPARLLYELSISAFDALVGAWMSELPIEAQMLRFGRKILSSKNRAEADKATLDRGDPDVRIVLETTQKVWHEVDRFRGLLRFNPDETGMYIARFSPDHYILPALAEHFSLRFGPTPWAIIDEKRGLCLRRINAGLPVYKVSSSTQLTHFVDRYELRATESIAQDIHTANVCAANVCAAPSDEWEQLWLRYHKTINNESRNNPDLQRQFMPKRYWKNLPEMR